MSEFKAYAVPSFMGIDPEKYGELTDAQLDSVYAEAAAAGVINKGIFEEREDEFLRKNKIPDYTEAAVEFVAAVKKAREALPSLDELQRRAANVTMLHMVNGEHWLAARLLRFALIEAALVVSANHDALADVRLFAYLFIRVLAHLGIKTSELQRGVAVELSGRLVPPPRDQLISNILLINKKDAQKDVILASASKIAAILQCMTGISLDKAVRDDFSRAPWGYPEEPNNGGD